MWRSAFLYLSTSDLVSRIAVGNPLARSIASRFVAGETLSQAIAAARVLRQRGMSVEMDYLGENVTDAGQAEAARDAYVALLERMARDGVGGDVSMKLSQMGMGVDRDLCASNVEAVVSRAASLGGVVWLDMEGSGYTDATLEMYERIRASHANVGVALQAYLYRTRADLSQVLSIGGTVRLCKGAYAEPPSVAYPSKRDVNRNYAELAEILLESGRHHAIATHDEEMVTHVIEYARRHRINEDQFEFQMLYGIRRDLQERLLAQGFIVRSYIPYGEEWYPYFMRRLAERPANLLFLLGSIVREVGRGPAKGGREAGSDDGRDGSDRTEPAAPSGTVR